MLPLTVNKLYVERGASATVTRLHAIVRFGETPMERRRAVIPTRSANPTNATGIEPSPSDPLSSQVRQTTIRPAPYSRFPVERPGRTVRTLLTVESHDGRPVMILGKVDE